MVTDVIVVVVGTGRVNAAPSELHVWLTQGGVSRGWKIGLAAAALWVFAHGSPSIQSHGGHGGLGFTVGISLVSVEENADIAASSWPLIYRWRVSRRSLCTEAVADTERQHSWVSPPADCCRRTATTRV